MDNKPAGENIATLNDKPKQLHILIEDPETKKIYADYLTDIAIVGAVQGTREKSKEGELQPTHVFYIGNSHQLGQMLFYIATEIGKNMKIVVEGWMNKKANPDKPTN